MNATYFCADCDVISESACNCSSLQKKRNQRILQNQAFIKDLGIQFPSLTSSSSNVGKGNRRLGTTKRDLPDASTLENAADQKAKLRRKKPPHDATLPSIGSHPKLSAAKYLETKQVTCRFCSKVIYNSKGLSDRDLLKWHQSQTKCYIHGLQTYDVDFDCGFDDMPEGEYQDDFMCSDISDSSVEHDLIEGEEDEDEDDDDSNIDESQDEDGGCREKRDYDEGLAVEQIFEDNVNSTGESDTRGLLMPVYSPRHVKKGGDILDEFDHLNLAPSDKIWVQQQKFEEIFCKSDGEVKFRNIVGLNDSVGVDWRSLLRIYKYGVAVGLSDAQGNELLALLATLVDPSSFQLRKTWRSLRDAVYKQKVKQAYAMGSFKFRLPPELFGTHHWRSGKPLRPFRATAVDVRSILADIFLTVDPKSFITDFVTPVNSSDGIDIPREKQILSDFCSGDLFLKICSYVRQFPPIDGARVVPLILGVWQDDTTLGPSRTTSECPVVMSVLNVIGCELHQIGFAPKHPPYSDFVLHKLLKLTGIKTKQHREEILNVVKTEVVKDFLLKVLQPVVEFGKNAFFIRVGSGEGAETVVAWVHVVLLGGDGKELDMLCGCHHGRFRNCRFCLESRSSLFTKPSVIRPLRTDSGHESLAFDLYCLHRRIVSGTSIGDGTRKRYKKTEEDKRLQFQGQIYGIKASEGRLYELFYGLNSVGIWGLHSAVLADKLHVILKGIVEKTLAWSLLVVNAVEKLFDAKVFGAAMSCLDARASSMAPIEFKWLRWVNFSNGLSQLLKTESRSAANCDIKTGLMSGGMFSWKFMSALVQLMFCIGSRGSILPIGNSMSAFGFQEQLIFDISDVVLSACASVFEMFVALQTGRCRYSEVHVIEYLIHNAGFHHLRLAMLLKAFTHCEVEGQERRPVRIRKGDLPSLPWTVGGNKFHYLMQHCGQSLRDMGADMDTFDTQRSEKSHLRVKDNYRKSSKRQYSRQEEMLQRSLLLRSVDRVLMSERGSTERVKVNDDVHDVDEQSSMEKTFSAADNIAYSKLRLAKINHKGRQFNGWTYNQGSTEYKFVHPLITTIQVSEAVEDMTGFFVTDPPEIFEMEVFLMASVKITEEDGSTWTLRCDPMRRRGHKRDDRFDGNSFQMFSGVCVVDEVARIHLSRVLGIILLRFKEDPTEDLPFSQYRFIVSRMEKVTSGHKSYLPYGIYRHKQSRGSGIDVSYIGQESIVRPAILVPDPDGELGHGSFESKGTMTSRAHLFFGIDTDRFEFPKPESFDSGFYTAMEDDAVQSRPFAAPRVFRTQRELSQTQLRLGLENFKRFDSEEKFEFDIDEEITANVISWLGV